MALEFLAAEDPQVTDCLRQELARQPEVGGRLFTNFIIGAALAEALALIGFVLAFIL